MITPDFRAGNDHLPSLQQAVAEAKQQNACGNVYLGDIKPNLITGNHKSWIEADRNYQQLFHYLEMAFPKAVWVWLTRHPDKFATSLTHWFRMKSEKEANEFLQKVRKLNARFHCSAWKHFGKRIIGQGNGKGDVVQLNLEQLDW